MASFSNTDPYDIEEIAGLQSYNNTDGKVVADPRLVAGENTFVAVMAGQSNIANYGETKFTPTNAAKVHNLSIVDGGMYRGKDPALGAGGVDGSWLFRFADSLVTAGTFYSVILVPIGVGSTRVDQWQSSGVLGRHIPTSCRRCDAHGLTISAFLWQQGESDQAKAVATYQTRLMDVINTTRAAG